MKVVSRVPVVFITGDIVDPNDLNENTEYVVNASNDVFSKRYVHCASTVSFTHTSTSGYRDTDNSDTRTFLFTAPVDVMLERAYLLGNYVSTSGIHINLIDSETADAPDNVVNPILSLGVEDDNTSTTEAIYVNSVNLAADNGYQLVLDSDGDFTVDRLDLLLHLRSDRFLTDGVDNFQPADSADLLLAEISSAPGAGSLSAADVVFASTTVSGIVASNAAVSDAVKVQFFQAAHFTSSTSSNLLTFQIPSVDSDRSETFIAMYCAAVWSSNGSAGNSVTWTLKDSAGSTVSSVTLSASGTSTADGSSSFTEDASGGDSGDITQDYTLTVSSNFSTNCIKSYCWLWSR